MILDLIIDKASFEKLDLLEWESRLLSRGACEAFSIFIDKPAYRYRLYLPALGKILE